MILTIAIPSHNSTELLAQAVQSIMREPVFGKEVKIVISDNSITKDTYNFYQKNYKDNEFISFYSSIEFDSLDSNVNRVVELADSKYVWIFGDDDLIVPGVLSDIVSFLYNHQPNILILNSESFNATRTIEKYRLPLELQTIYEKDEDDKFLFDMARYLTYVGCILIKRELWVDNYNHDLIGSYFAHLSLIATVKIGRTAHYYHSPAIRMRVGTQTWSSKSFLIWNILFPKMIWSFDHYSDEVKSSIISRHPMNSYKRMLSSRAYGFLTFNIWKKIVLPSEEVLFICKIYTLLISILPRIYFILLYKLYIKFVRNKHTIGFSPELALNNL